MFLNHATNQGQDPAKVELKPPPEPRLRGCSHLQHNQPGPGFEHARGFGESAIEIHQVAEAPADHGTIERVLGKRKIEGVGGDGYQPRRLLPTQLQHLSYEISTDDAAPKSGRPGKGRPEVQRAGAEVEIDSLRSPLPPQQLYCPAAPALIEVEADDPVEPIVGGSDGGEHRADVRPLFRTA